MALHEGTGGPSLRLPRFDVRRQMGRKSLLGAEIACGPAHREVKRVLLSTFRLPDGRGRVMASDGAAVPA
jgi:hypothetical protein